MIEVLKLLAILLGIWVVIKLFRVILRFLFYAIIAIPLWVVLFFVPGYLDEIGLAAIIFLVAALSKHLPGGYVLNKKTGVIHNRWSDDADSISEAHKKELTYSEATALVNSNSKKYRFRK